MSYIVTASSLNLRRGPSINDPVIGSLPNGTTVNVIEKTNADWWKVQAMNGTATGYAAAKYLREIPVVKPPADMNPHKVTPVHYPTSPQSNRNSINSRHCPLSETDLPKRNTAGNIQSKNADAHAIVAYLDVVNSLRYQRTTQSTYCNIYAYDFCYLAQAYLPRVWWTSKTLMEFAKTPGYNPAPAYAKNVNELNANSLFDWLEEWSDDFGWVRATSLDEVQAKVNEGRVGLICAKRKVLSRSGHITCVVPEIAGNPNVALRQNGKVVAPLQSQAGATNKKFFATVWWTSSEFSEFGFWYHD
ncbi:MAG: hypothetical protein FD123_2871 [Bacteroidetes bacterium]|nr:MAG: hypothetical protein FD123_2871 [Bacteroidota bacterium]